MINVNEDCIRIGNKLICWDCELDAIVELQRKVIDPKTLDNQVLLDLFKHIASHRGDKNGKAE